MSKAPPTSSPHAPWIFSLPASSDLPRAKVEFVFRFFRAAVSAASPFSAGLDECLRSGEPGATLPANVGVKLD